MTKPCENSLIISGLEISAHDLLWGMSLEQLDVAAPSWLHDRVAAGIPVVVRRDQQRANQVAVGIRGVRKSERYATWMLIDSIVRHVKPEQIRVLPHSDDAVQQTLLGVAQLLGERNWGVTGSYAFSAVTGEHTATASSDLDVLWRQATAMAMEEAKDMYAQMKQLPIPVDVQIETGVGGFSLADWVNSTGRVLLKTNHGPQLRTNPWLKEEAK